MKVWFVSHYAMPPQYEMREKTQKYASYFASQGHDVKIVTASTIHGTSINLIEDRTPYIEREYNGLKFVHIRCSQYTGNGISRIKNMIEFGRRLQKNFHRFEKPDVIVVDVNCINYSSIARICKKNGIKFVIEVRDLWPLSIVEYLHYSPHNPIIRYLYHRERNMYIQADAIIFSMEGGWQYIVDKGWDKLIDESKVYYINNGVDIRNFDFFKTSYTYQDKDLDDLNSFKLIYTGSMRTANNLTFLIDAAKQLASINPKIRILIFGDGDERAGYEVYANSLLINNVLFKGKVDKKYIPFVLSKGNLNILNYQSAGTWKYGGSQNKLFEYLASGNPVIANFKMGYSIIDKYECGISLDNPSVDEYISAIQYLYNLNKNKYSKMRSNARRTAEMFDYEILSRKLLNIVQGN